MSVMPQEGSATKMRSPFIEWGAVNPAHKINLLQMLVGLLVVCLWWLKEPFSAYSAGLGLLIAVIPQLFFAKKVFAKQGARAAKQIIRAFYLGEAIKWSLTFALFAIVFVNIKPDASALISTFAITQIVVPLFALLVIKNNRG
jgi:ATP synthase protein I